MKFTYPFVLLTLLAFGACKNQATIVETASPFDWIQNATIYEVNLRHYSPEGNIAGFMPHLDRLQALGVDVLWFMPIQPIGVLNRKATGNLFAQDIADSNERGKYLGSPYSIGDYRAVNPDYGTVTDFKNLVNACHERGMMVLIDWVGNHTAWDHPWIADHPDWYTHKNGKITDPLNDKGESIGWTDVADLNYENRSLWEAMTADMKFWVEECDIDGFRCDVAFEVPAAFWDSAAAEIRKTKDVFMLAEAEGHNMDLFKGTFQSYYAWNVHHQMNQLAQGKITASDFYTEWTKLDTLFGNKAFPMNFITNHDENSWNGTEFERMGDKWRIMAVLSYALKGMPLLYTGQEVGLNHRLKFFEKDLVDWQTDSAAYYTSFYRMLNNLKNHSDLAASADIQMSHNQNLLKVQRGGHVFFFNCSYVVVAVNIGATKEILLHEAFENGILGPWGYLAVE